MNRRAISRNLFVLALLIGATCGIPGRARAQQPPPEGEPASPPVFDPLRAEKAIEVGKFHMKRGNYDAAIERFSEATQLRPNFALAYKLLGEAQEKKGRKAAAIKSYEKYLQILPRAEDADKIHQRIEKLRDDLKRSPAKHPSR